MAATPATPASPATLDAGRAPAEAPRSEPARRSSTEIQIATGPGAFASSWHGDGAVAQSLKLGLRFVDAVSIDALTRLGYGAVDERVLTYLSLGATIYGRIKVVRPYVRLALVHQHEEPTSAVRDDPFGALFGVGNGIRHRGGFGGSLGVDVPVWKKDRTEFVLGIDGTTTWFPDPRGPNLYYGGSLWAGLNYGL